MKTMKQRTLFPTALAAVLALLAAGCALPGLEPPAAPETGVVRVSIGAGPARTLLPSAYEAASLYYTLTFTPAAGSGLGTVYERLTGSAAGDFALGQGTWDLAVLGFAGEEAAAETANALVSGSASGIAVSGSGGTAVTVALTPAAAPSALTQSGAGTLAWDVAFPGGVTQATLTVYDDTGTAVTLDGEHFIDLLDTGANPGSVSLPFGIYDLALRLYLPGKALITGVTAHIYDRMVTTADYTFADTDFAAYSPEAFITGFTLSDGTNTYTGSIDPGARTITVYVPLGVEESSFTAAVTHTGLALRPDPAVARSYAAPVTYAVIPEDGTAWSYTVQISTAEVRVQTKAELEALLDAAPSGGTAANPVLVKVEADLADAGGNGWGDFLAAIQAKGKYVSLDLADCTMAGMTGTPGEFDPGTANTGENRIVSLVLPGAATSVKAGTTGDPTFKYFTALKSAGGTAVTGIGDYAFSDRTALTTVAFPAAAAIGAYAFRDCFALETVHLPAATTIGNYAFTRCVTLETINLPAATGTGTYAFDGCTALTTVYLPEAVGTGNYAFQNCTALTTVDLPAATATGTYAFSGCTALETVALPAATNIGQRTFNGCTALKTVYLPEAATIGTYVFIGCTSLETVALPEVTNIRDATFQNCTALTTADLPKATTFGSFVFQNTALETADFPEALTLTQTFSGCTTLQTVRLPKATGIGDNAFNGCAALTTVNLPEAISIGMSAFNGCTALTTVDLPEATSIGNNAFFNCTALETAALPAATAISTQAFMGTGTQALTVILGTTAPTVGNSAFNNIIPAKTVTVLVPAGATGYGTIPAVYDGTDITTENWGYAFRGKSWNGTTYGSGTVNPYITLVIEYITP